MNSTAVAVGVVALAAAVYALSHRPQAEEGDVATFDDVDDAPPYEPGFIASFEDVLTNPVESVAETIDRISGGFLRISKMSQVTPDLLNNANVQAVLRVIRRGEGTADDAGYRRIFGGRMFESFADHPRIKVTASGYTSTAAGAYQALASTWDETAAILHLPDFSPESQDLFAVARIVYRKALDDVLAGDLEAALPKLGREWASMPGSPYGQPTISVQTCLNTFAAAGGSFA